MTMHVLSGPPEPDLREALATFERQFVYPLGPGRTFRIDHGEDYPRFYRAIGDGRCFVWEEAGRVLGVAAVAIRPVLGPDGASMSVAYVGDVKTAPGPRRGAVLLRLVRAAEGWCRPQVEAAFGVVMDGTPAVPTAYTGRLGIPPFVEVGKVIVFRFLCGGGGRPHDETRPGGVEASCRELFQRLGAGRFACPPGTPRERSSIAPTWLVDAAGKACGCLEDTRRGKRLIANDGSEMKSAHLSGFAYDEVRAGAELLRHAIGRAGEIGFPALFVSVPVEDADAMRAALADMEAVRAPATVFAHGIPPGGSWIVNSSEI